MVTCHGMPDSLYHVLQHSYHVLDKDIAVVGSSIPFCVVALFASA